ncbi:hypothetical protein [Streptomyces sp. GS7]|uniref:hypothetical protein n=1 Tax=Streptomyces sp. GS7 TaxID=2692234 RepID=UPI001315E355|nr:hypothetical protein [Streptomyces sp. GS7]QHC24576.1 hypothetical protein GR130_27610 [Streptomyces sp. GS7]
MVGTSTDCYQRAEGRYELMPGILRALIDYRVPFTTTTKSALLHRDIPLYAEDARVTDVLVMTSLDSLSTWPTTKPLPTSAMATMERWKPRSAAARR